MTKKQKTAIFSLIVISAILVTMARSVIERSPQLPQTAPACTPAPITSTPTPWIQQEILIEMSAGKGLTIWIDNPEQAQIKLNNASDLGIISATIMDNDHSIYVLIDPRYRKAKAAQEITKLLTIHQTGPK